MSAVPARQMASQTSDPSGSPKCRVLVVDDSAVLRRMLSKALQSDPEIMVVEAVGDGQQAVDAVSRLDVDVVVLDVEMPTMDGLTALPKILQAAPGIQVLMASKLTLKGAEISVNALSAGAADYLAKPSATGEGLSLTEFNRELVSKVKALGGAARSLRRRSATRPSGTATRAPVDNKPVPATAVKSAGLFGDSAVQLRSAPPVFRPKILAIGSSTGGPQALMKLLTDLCDYHLTLPIVITQHMPPMFTKILAQQISSKCGYSAAEAEDGQQLVPGNCYIAPGGKHLHISAKDGQFVANLSDGPPVHFCKPAVDPMLTSLVSSVGAKHVLTVILTGMGYDGRDGGRAIVEQGGVLLAQDEESSVVWGMPGAVATAGLCHGVVPIDKMGEQVAKYAGLAAARGTPARSTA